MNVFESITLEFREPLTDGQLRFYGADQKKVKVINESTLLFRRPTDYTRDINNSTRFSIYYKECQYNFDTDKISDVHLNMGTGRHLFEEKES